VRIAVHSSNRSPIHKPTTRGPTPRIEVVAGVVEYRDNAPGTCPTMRESYFKIKFDSHMLSAYEIEVSENIYDKMSIMIP
jgi:hypothetical protein